jgi:hypothetical protein
LFGWLANYARIETAECVSPVTHRRSRHPAFGASPLCRCASADHPGSMAASADSRTSSRTPNVAGPRWRVARIALWFAASALVGFAPLLYVITGLGEDVTEGSRIGAAAFPVALAWPLLLSAAVLALRRTGRSARRVGGGALARSVVLVAYAGAALAAARALGAAVTIRGDAAWTLVWLAATAGWVALSVACLRRAER